MSSVIYKQNKGKTLDKLLNSDVIISDFDGTDVKSPLKNAAISFCSKPCNLINNPRLFPWAVEAGMKRIFLGKDAESGLWKKFSEIIEQDLPTLISDVRDGFNSKGDSIDNYFLDGVKDFYSLLPNSEKYYASRNFEDILYLFGERIDIPQENIYAELTKKSCALDDIIEKRKSRGSFGGIYVLKGDSKSDDEILDVADFYKKKDLIDDYVGIAIGNSSHSTNSKVDIIVPSNQTQLVSDMREYILETR